MKGEKARVGQPGQDRLKLIAPLDIGEKTSEESGNPEISFSSRLDYTPDNLTCGITALIDASPSPGPAMRGGNPDPRILKRLCFESLAAARPPQLRR